CALLLWPSETNTTKECKQDLLERLKQLDFDIKEDEIFTSLTAARNLLEQKKFRPLLMLFTKQGITRRKMALPSLGPFVTGLEYATDQKATVVGKPEQTFFLEALRGTNCGPEEAVMIGDICIGFLQLPFLSKRSGQFTVQT
ncbi:putative Chain A The Of Haloacid Dehalogenase-Like Hydrolase Domain Containing 2 protein, partial [Naja naja]